MPNIQSKGFVTIATGREWYYQLAVNLLHSYRKATEHPLPFAIICDKENQYTREFDKVVVMEHPTCSYMDKLTMLSIPPFDFNIFIDADCLAYGDLNKYFEIEGNDTREGVWTFGSANPIESREGWFQYENTGKYREQVKYLVDSHGGVIFFRDDQKTKEMYRTCLDIAQDYASYHFRMFVKPADEPVLALCMAIHGVIPIYKKRDENASQYLFYPIVKELQADITKHQLSYTYDGKLWHHDVLLLHWANGNCSSPLYRREQNRLAHGHRLLDDWVYAVRNLIHK